MRGIDEGMLEKFQCLRLFLLTLSKWYKYLHRGWKRTAANSIGEQDDVGHSRANVFARFTSLSIDCRVVVAAALSLHPGRYVRNDSPTVSSMDCHTPLIPLVHRRFGLSLDYSGTKGTEKKLELHGFVIDYLTVDGRKR